MVDIEVAPVNETSSYPTGLVEASLAAAQANQSLFQDSFSKINPNGELWQNAQDGLVSDTHKYGPVAPIAIFGTAGVGGAGLIYLFHRFQDNAAFRTGMFRGLGGLGAISATPSLIADVNRFATADNLRDQFKFGLQTGLDVANIGGFLGTMFAKTRLVSAAIPLATYGLKLVTAIAMPDTADDTSR